MSCLFESELNRLACSTAIRSIVFVRRLQSPLFALGVDFNHPRSERLYGLGAIANVSRLC